MKPAPFALALLLLCPAVAAARQWSPRAATRAELLRELRKCVYPQRRGCDEESVDNVAWLYERGDRSVLPKLMDVAPHSDGALSESLGVFFSQLLCRKPETFLRAVLTRPRAERDNLLFLAAVADGGGMGCRNLPGLRKSLRRISLGRDRRMAGIAKRCLEQVDEHNPAE